MLTMTCRQVREELHHEALQFVKEQRIRCLLQGAWFQQLGYAGEDTGGPITQESLDREVPTSWKYVKLSHNRRYVHYATFKEKTDVPPGLEKLEEKGKWFSNLNLQNLEKKRMSSQIFCNFVHDCKFAKS